MSDNTELKELKEAIKHFRKKYWEGNPEVSDEYYDNLIAKLYEIDPLDELLTDPEGPMEIEDKVYHSIPMLSLEKKYSFEEVQKWMESVSRSPSEEFEFMPKFDGLASRYYPDIKTLATRGCGTFGENISDKLPLIDNIKWEDVESDISGEIVISLEDFKNCKLVKKDATRYKHPRNLVAGITNLKDIKEVIDKNVKLTFVKYDSYSWSVYKAAFTLEFFETTLEKVRSLNFPTDGMVIKLKDEQYGLSLGFTGHHFKHSIAFKDYDKEYPTKIKDIILQHGKNKLTPVAIIEPVTINGVTISRASLHNAKNILDHNICIGDTAYVIRSNDVIPYITKTEPGEVRTRPGFKHCHICNSELDYIEPELYCLNTECSGNLIKQLLEACRSLDVENIGQPTIEKMVNQLNVETITDVITLSINDLLELEGFAYQSAKKLYDSFGKTIAGTEDYKILAALNIKGIGKGIFKDIMAQINISQLLVTKPTNLMAFNNLGYDRAFAIYNGLNNNMKVLDELRNIINVIETKKSIGTTIKPKVCFSGTFKYPKDYYKRIAIQKGYEVVEDVSKEIKFLITSGSMTNKYSKAVKYQVEILDAEDFLKLQ